MELVFASIARNTIPVGFEKGGKPAKIGEIRDWNGVKVQKTIDGWKPLPKPIDRPYRRFLEPEEFTGYPEFDEVGLIESPQDAVNAILADPEFQRGQSFQYFYWNTENRALRDYLNDNLDLDDKRFIVASLGLTGMLSVDIPDFEFTEKAEDISLYSDELGQEDTSTIYCYDSWKVPKEIADLGTMDKKRGYFYIWNNEMDQDTFAKRAHGNIPSKGLLWACTAGGYSGTVSGYWCRDKMAKDDMKGYCGFEEYKDGVLVD